MKESSKTLIIDTATKYIYLSLVIDGKELTSVYEEGVNNHSVTIIPYLEQILSKANLGLKDIDRVIIGIGPGSYTGVRIGVTVAKMIGYLNNIKVYSVSSLALMASSSETEYILPMIDARRGNAFMGVYRLQNNILTVMIPDVLENISDFKSRLTMNYDVVLEGKPDISKIINSGLLNYIEDINALIPNYLQKTEAERNREQK